MNGPGGRTRISGAACIDVRAPGRVLSMLISSARLRVKIIGAMAAVAVIAMLLGFYVGISRVMRRQAFCRQEAARYAQLARREEEMERFFTNQAAKTSAFADRVERSIQQNPPPGVSPFDSPMENGIADAKMRSYDAAVTGARKCLKYADEARARAARFSALSEEYAEASRRWVSSVPRTKSEPSLRAQPRGVP